MTFLLPRTSAGTVVAAQAVAIHGDRYVDVTLALDDAPGAPLAARLGASDCPANLEPGERVEARLVLGNLVGLARAAR